MSQRTNRESLIAPIVIPLIALFVIVVSLFALSRLLLAVSHSAATFVALVAAAAVVAVAAFVAARPRVTGASLLSMAGLVVGVVLLAGGGALMVSPAHTEEEGGEGQVLAIAAPPNAAVDGFDPTTLSAVADSPITIEFDNADPSVPHNVVVNEGPTAEDAILVEGEIVTGPIKTTYEVGALAEGSYFFFCSVHPTSMTGTIEVAAGGGGATGGTTTALAANGQQFDTDLITLAADTESTIAFDNQEALPHNLAIYADDTLADTLFKGEIVTGPISVDYAIPALAEGEYYFHCDVHPPMQGTVVVGGTPPDEGG